MGTDPEPVDAASGGRRAVARLIDALWLLPGAALIVRSLYVYTGMSWGWQLALLAVAVGALQLLVEPLMLSTAGATPGKALAGLRVAGVAGSRRLTYSQALGRTLKALALGFGFWLLPLTILALAMSAWRMRAQGALPWEHSEVGGRVVKAPIRVGTGLSLLAVAALPGLVLPLASMVVGVALLGSLSLNASQDISRAVTGQWQWLHRLTGATLPLDARWRVLHDYFSVRRAEWVVAFAYGVGEDNRVLYEVRAAPAKAGSACTMHRLAMEDEGFVFIEESHTTAAGEERCVATGGKVGRRGVVHVDVEAHRGPRGDHSVTRIYARDEPRSREAVDRLARSLVDERERVDAANGAFGTHHWRNDLSGIAAQVPGDWELTERNVNANGAISFVFRRAPSQAAPESASIMAFPIDFFDQGIEPHAQVEKHLAELNNAARAERLLLPGGEALSHIPVEGGVVRVWTRRDPLTTWAAVWEDRGEGARVDEVAKHPLLSELRKTMR